MLAVPLALDYCGMIAIQGAPNDMLRLAHKNSGNHSHAAIG